MAIQRINLGTAPSGTGGDTNRSAFTKIDGNFADSANAASRLVGTAAGNVMEVGAFGGQLVAAVEWFDLGVGEIGECVGEVVVLELESIAMGGKVFVKVFHSGQQAARFGAAGPVGLPYLGCAVVQVLDGERDFCRGAFEGDPEPIAHVVAAGV